jgi:hypothetical protein
MNKPKYQDFMKSVLGEHGFVAIQNAAAKMPELMDAVPAQTILSWTDVAARIEFDGEVPATAHRFAIKKNETGFDVTLNGNSAHVDHITQAATVIADVLGFVPSAKPTIRKSQLDQLIKTIDMLAKFNLAKAVGGAGGGVQAPGDKGTPNAATLPVGQTPTQPQKQVANKIPTKMGSGASTGTKTKGPTALPSVSAKPPKLAATPKGPQTSAAKAPTQPAVAKKGEPKIAALDLNKAQRGCPTCLKKAFNDERFVGCGCFKELAKSTYSKRVEQGYVVFFNYQWDSESIHKLINDYRG